MLDVEYNDHDKTIGEEKEIVLLTRCHLMAWGMLVVHPRVGQNNVKKTGKLRGE